MTTAVPLEDESLPMVRRFVGRNTTYYHSVFARIHGESAFRPGFNGAAALAGPLWAGARGLWGSFWTLVVTELLALVLLGRGWFGDLGADSRLHAAKLAAVAQTRDMDAKVALQAGDPGTAETFHRIAVNLHAAADNALAQAQQAADSAPRLVVLGIALWLFLRLAFAIAANPLYARRYVAWRTRPAVGSGFDVRRLLLAVLLVLLMYPVTVFRFTAAEVPVVLLHVPVAGTLAGVLAGWIDAGFAALYSHGAGFFDGMRDVIRFVVHALETVLVSTPWMVTMALFVVGSWHAAGRRVAMLTGGAVAYIAVIGLWELSMQTVALVATAAAGCVALGLPLGIWCGRSPRAFRLVRPLLDLMQTMPAMVYLIPAIAFLGTGTPPGVVATLCFGLPPMVRLTALGIQQVPAEVCEAARAYGASDWQLLCGVELPLARPSIMAGVSQTLLMCLSMVVVAALVGAQGLGTVVLESLQYAASGRGILAGFAILLCAVVIDRVVQGAFAADDK
jgi:glycine betaine/proline transport system permease protein